MDPISKELNRKITDRTIEHIKRLHHNKMNLSNILNELNSLTQIRHTLDDPNINKSEISSYFRDINSLIKDEILKLRDYDISHRLNLFIFTFVSSYSNTISISAKRNLIANIINHRALDSKELLLWLDLIRNNKLDYGYLPDSLARSTIESIFNSNEYKQTMNNLSTFMIELIKNDSSHQYLTHKYYDLISPELGVDYQL